MIGKLFLAAALLLTPLCAYGAKTSENLVIQVVPQPSSDFCARPPSQAAINAGYTTLVMCVDFSQANSSWIDYSGNKIFGADHTTPPFVSVWFGSMAYTHGANALFLTQDQGPIRSGHSGLSRPWAVYPEIGISGHSQMTLSSPPMRHQLRV
jgi:hypothetical protein